MWLNAWLVILVAWLPDLPARAAPPCRGCESYHDDHPLPRLLPQEVECGYPCKKCPGGLVPECGAGVAVVRDRCGCCLSCAGQIGHPCDSVTLCDTEAGLACHYPSATAKKGVCKEKKGMPCNVFNHTYEHGETFMTDCRTQCACQNGRYACSSLCPKENIPPAGSRCRLVDLPGQCCREWMCDSHTGPKECVVESTPWSECSSTCGGGLSRRTSNDNPACQTRNETRLCQIRPCPGPLQPQPPLHQHRLRKGHECKATHRESVGVRARFASCVSRRRLRPRWCGGCGCTPELSTTLPLEMVCLQPEDTPEDLTQGQGLWTPRDPPREGRRITVTIQWVTKCSCPPRPTPAPGLRRVHRTAAP